MLAQVRGAGDFHHTEWNGIGAVFDIKQSRDGYLWLTTSRGVLRFDGVRFRSLEEVTLGAVRDNEIDSVFLSSSGGLWLTTESAGLLLWRDGQLSTFPDRHCTPTRKQGQVIEDGDGSLWVQGASGLFHMRGSKCEQIGTRQGYPGGFAAGIFMDSDGTLWVKTRIGPLLYLPRGQANFAVSKYGEGPSTSYAFIRESPDGGIWLSDDRGLRRVANKLSSADSPPPGRGDKRNAQFGDFTFASDGSLWAVTTEGVRRFDHVEQWPAPVATGTAPGEIFTPAEGLSSDAAWKVLIDREGVVWVGTNSGLDQLRHNVLSRLALPHAQEREFSVATGDEGSVWTGNSNLPLTRIAADGKMVSFPGIRQIVCLRRDHTGTIWVAGEGDFRLGRYSGSQFTPVHYPDEALDSVVSVAVDSQNDPWITARSGKVYHFFKGVWHNQNKALGKKPGVIGAMVDDPAGNVWFSFSDRLVEWDGSGLHTFVRKVPGISETTMSVRGDRVWLGGPGGVQLAAHGKFHTMRWKNPDLPGRVSGVLETAAGDLWTNGFSGIAHVSAAELKKWLGDPTYAVSGEHFDELDGLPGLSGEKLPEPSVAEASDGRLWFATTKGIAWLDPASLERNRNRLPPPVEISAVIANEKTYAAADGLVLPPRTENLEIDYAALSMAIPERVFFRYKLEGVDRDWQNAGTRHQAYYTGLRPGSYRFRVAACNNDGVWNEAGAALDLKVSPAWFQTGWFFFLCAASGAGLVAGMHRLRVRYVEAGITARFDDRLAERTRIAQELHDTLLQGFLSASMHVHLAADRVGEDSPAAPLLTRALQLMSQVIDEGRNAVRGLRSPHSVCLDLEQAFAGIQDEVGPEGSSGRGIRFRVIAEGKRRALHPLLRDEVYRIGREALLNAFRHARAHRIDVTVTYSTDRLRVQVRDDGRGIDPEILRSGREGHWGLSGMRERADRIGGKFRVMSSSSAGTEVELLIPGKIAYRRNQADAGAADLLSGAVESADDLLRRAL